MRFKTAALAVYVVAMGFLARPAQAELPQDCSYCYPYGLGACIAVGGTGWDCTYNGALAYQYCADDGNGIYEALDGDDMDSCMDSPTGDFYEVNCLCPQ